MKCSDFPLGARFKSTSSLQPVTLKDEVDVAKSLKSFTLIKVKVI